MPRSFRLVGGALLTTVALLAAGCDAGSGSQNAGPATTTATADASPETADSPSPADDDTTADTADDPSDDTLGHADPAGRAAETALQEIPGDVLSVDPEGGDVWSVLVRAEDGTGTEVYVDAETGQVHRQHPDDVPAAARDAAPTLTAVEAIDIALATVPGAAIRELDVDVERGVVVWEIEVRTDTGRVELYIDANDGTVLKQEND